MCLTRRASLGPNTGRACALDKRQTLATPDPARKQWGHWLGEGEIKQIKTKDV